MSDSIMQLHSTFESFATSQRQVAINSRRQRRRPHGDCHMADTSVQSPYRYLTMNQHQVKQEHFEQYLHSHQMINKTVPNEATMPHSPAYINMNSQHDRLNNNAYDSCCYGELPVNRRNYEHHYKTYIETNYIKCAETNNNIATPDKCVQDAIRQTIDGVFSVYTPPQNCTRDPVGRRLEQTTLCKDYVTGSETFPMYRKVPSDSHTYCDGTSPTSPLSSDSGRDSFSGDEPYSVCSSVGNSLVEEFDSDAESSIFTDDESICSTCSCDDCKEDDEIMNQSAHNHLHDPYPSEYETLNDADNTYESIGSIDVLDSPVPPPLPPRNYPRRRHTKTDNCRLDLKGCRCKDIYHEEKKLKPTDIIDSGKQHMYTVSDILESVQKLSLDITEEENVEMCPNKVCVVDLQPYVELEDKSNSSFSRSNSQMQYQDFNRAHKERYIHNLPRPVSPPLYQRIDGEIFV